MYIYGLQYVGISTANGETSAWHGTKLQDVRITYNCALPLSHSYRVDSNEPLLTCEE